MEGMRYKDMYAGALQEVCSYLKVQRDYEEILRLCGAACEMYPFDEWQVLRIDCYIAMNRYKEYEDTAKLFFEELGISPSERMLEQMKVFSREHRHWSRNLDCCISSAADMERESSEIIFKG